MKCPVPQGKVPAANATNSNLHLADLIARRLSRRYSWVPFEDLQSYAYIGLSKASELFDSSRGIPFSRFACVKAMFLAVDEMRRDRVIRRCDMPDHEKPLLSTEVDLVDHSAGRAMEKYEAREYCESLLMGLDREERHLLSMIYADRMTYCEVSEVFGISESAICLRHRKLIDKLRRKAARCAA